MTLHHKIRKIHNSKWVLVLIGILALVIIYFSVTSKTEPTSKPQPSTLPIVTTPQSLNGIYKGNMPCADCEGISETLILATDNSFILEDIYLGKDVEPFRTQGKWEIVDNILKLTYEDSQNNFYKILENGDLNLLDPNKNPVSTLKKS